MEKELREKLLKYPNKNCKNLVSNFLKITLIFQRSSLTHVYG